MKTYEIFGSSLAYRPDVKDVFGHRERRVFLEMVRRVEIGPAPCLRVGGRKRKVSKVCYCIFIVSVF